MKTILKNKFTSIILKTKNTQTVGGKEIPVFEATHRNGFLVLETINKLVNQFYKGCEIVEINYCTVNKHQGGGCTTHETIKLNN